MIRPATTDHEHSAQIELAVEWLKSQPMPPRPAVAILKERFGLSAIEACEAIAQARRLPLWRASHAA